MCCLRASATSSATTGRTSSPSWQQRASCISARSYRGSSDARGVRESPTRSPGSGLILGVTFLLPFSSCAWPLRSGLRLPVFLPSEVLWSLALQVLPGCCPPLSPPRGPSRTQRRLIPHEQVKRDGMGTARWPQQEGQSLKPPQAGLPPLAPALELGLVGVAAAPGSALPVGPGTIISWRLDFRAGDIPFQLDSPQEWLPHDAPCGPCSPPQARARTELLWEGAGQG